MDNPHFNDPASPEGTGDAVWTTVRDTLRERMLPQSFETWIAPLALGSLTEDIAQVIAPNAFYIEWLAQHYDAHIANAFAEALGRTVAVEYTVATATHEVPEATLTPAPEAPVPPTSLRAISPAFSTAATVPGSSDAGDLDARYTFGSFVVGGSNQFAHAAALAVAAEPGRRYNPLFIYGGVGLGKTHVMHAIGHALRAQQPDARIVYVSSERYMNELITSIQRGKILDFKDKYRSVDLLLIDDIQFMEAKERTQEEFFHTFNALYEGHKQIVLTSDRPPHEITKLEERLVSRFQCGLVADIQAPDVETRVAILKAKAEAEGQHLTDELALFVAHAASANIRELEGAFKRLMAIATLNRKPLSALTLQSAENALQMILRPSRTAVRQASVDELAHLVAERYGVTVDAMRGKRRTSTVAEARQVTMYLCRQLTSLSLADIGQRFGKRDHTTVLYACDKVRNLVATHDSLRTFVEQVIRSFGGDLSKM